MTVDHLMTSKQRAHPTSSRNAAEPHRNSSTLRPGDRNFIASTKREPRFVRNSRLKLATLKGLEPSTSAVTGRRSNQLSYNARLVVGTVGIEPTTPRV